MTMTIPEFWKIIYLKSESFRFKRQNKNNSKLECWSYIFVEKLEMAFTKSVLWMTGYLLAAQMYTFNIVCPNRICNWLEVTKTSNYIKCL